jgi:hypothetical protein
MEHTNGLSDHDAQSITLHSIGVSGTRKKGILIRKINACSINDFILKLSHESWDSVFSSDDVKAAFNSFIDSYQRILNSSFTLKRVNTTKKNNNWITLGISTSCKRKRELDLACRSSKTQTQYITIKNTVKFCPSLLRKQKSYFMQKKLIFQ